MQTRVVEGVAAIPAEWDALFRGAPVQSGKGWFAATEQAALPPGTTAVFVLCHAHGRPAAAIPLARTRTTLGSLTTPYTTAYQPLLDPALDDEGVRRVGQALGGVGRAYPTMLLEALDPEWPAFGPLLQGLSRAGLVPQPFDHFGNWRQPLDDWDSYLAARPGSLRETIRRKSAAAARDPAMRLECIATPGALGRGIEAFEAVYGQSWKEPEPYAAFNRTLLPILAEAGVLRLAIAWLGQTPIAAQYWTVSQGTGTVLKLAHDEAHKARSAGTVLTAWMIRQLIEQDRVHMLDFGRGDDPYKRLWMGERRQRRGVLLANPRRARGLAAILRHQAGLLRANLRRI